MDATIQLWSQFGLAGLVIGTLFAGFAIVGKYVLNQLQKNDEAQHAFLQQVVGEHKLERAEWKASIEKVVGQTCDAIEKNSIALEKHTDVIQKYLTQSAKHSA